MSPREIIADILPLASGSVFVLGLCVGSFLNVCIWRLPRGESIVSPGSHCPKCNHEIRSWENIPVLSWLLLRGRCSRCGQSISLRYPLVELAAGIGFLLVWGAVWSQNLPLSQVLACFFLTGALVAITLIDFEHLLIPDEITGTGVIIAFGLALIFPQTHYCGLASYPLPRQDPLIIGAICDALSRWMPTLMRCPRAIAVLDAAAGMLVGAGVLAFIREIGSRVWGRNTCRPPEPENAVLTPDGIRIADDCQADWQDLLVRRSDRFTADASVIEIARREDAAKSAGSSSIAEGTLVATREWLAVNSERIAWDDLTSVRAVLERWTLPREVLGLGDVKMLGMIGAFLGADACIFILMLSSVLGSLVGIGLVAANPRRRHVPIPFGPFLAIGTFLWILAGQRLVECYGRIVMLTIGR